MNEARNSTAPRRPLGLSSLIGITFFCVAGGAYGLEDAVGAVGPFWALLAILAAPWIWSLPTALMAAELSAAMPEDGGYVVWVERAFGPFWAFQEGWWSWICSLADNALYPVMFVEYLKYWLPHLASWQFWLFGLGMIAAMAWLNVRGIALIGAGSALFTALVLLPFGMMVVLGLPHLQPAVWLSRSSAPPAAGWSVLLSVILWNYCGWDNAGCCAGEVDDPGRAYPRAMIFTVFLVLLAYLLPVAVGVSADHHWSLWKDGYFPEVARRIGGNWLGAAMMAGGCVAALGLFGALLCTSARVPWAMARRGMLPPIIGRVHARYGTPWAAILLNALGSALLIGWAANTRRGPFVALVQIDMLLYSLALVLEFAALVRLRIKEPALPRPYRVPGGTWGVVLLSVPPLVICMVSIALCPHVTQALGAAGIALGWLVYASGHRNRMAGRSEGRPAG